MQQCLSKKDFKKDHTTFEKRERIDVDSPSSFIPPRKFVLFIPFGYFEQRHEKFTFEQIIDYKGHSEEHINILTLEEDTLSESVEVEPSEDVITGKEAIRFYSLIMSPPENPLREKIIEDALRKFPNPEQPTEVDIDL
ncbi:MAG: hypothetical protein K9W43_08900 [Candidatus Thorarchaeota archaeon]|nr:hypothetical protein [Candidatus Thorarchaeota archaeon]